MAEELIVSSERLQELKERSKRCVCKYCGSSLKVRLIDFGQIATANMEIFCPSCDLIEYGVEPEIYQSALYLVEALGFNAYPDRPDDPATRKLGIGKVCELISWHDRQMGFLNEHGYQVPINNTGLLSAADGSIIVSGDALAER